LWSLVSFSFVVCRSCGSALERTLWSAVGASAMSALDDDAIVDKAFVIARKLDTAISYVTELETAGPLKFDEKLRSMLDEILAAHPAHLLQQMVGFEAPEAGTSKAELDKQMGVVEFWGREVNWTMKQFVRWLEEMTSAEELEVPSCKKFNLQKLLLY
jgi:hypothetical protein